MTFYASQVPILNAAREFALMGLVPAGSFANRRFCESHIQIAPGIDPMMLDLLSDAQTNGGLLLSVAPAAAATVVTRFQESGLPATALVGEVKGTGKGIIHLEP
jgi:selenide,water dikinase